MMRLTKRALLLLSLGAAFAGRLAAAPAAAAEPLSWPDQGPYHQVGDGQEDEAVQMPVPVIEFLSKRLHEGPAKWAVWNISHRAEYRERVVEVTGGSKTLQYTYLLVAGGQWVNLRAPENVPRLNGIVALFPAAGLQDEAKLESYLQGLITLHGGFANLLTEAYPPLFGEAESREGPTSYEQWFHGNQKLGQALARLKHNPEVSRGPEPGQVVVRANVARKDGAMERWSFYLQVGQVVTVARIDIAVLYRPGTFTPVI